MNGSMQAAGVVTVVKKPEVKELNNGKTLCTVYVVWDSGYGDKKESHFIQLTAWNKQAELLNKYCDVGSKIFISGDLRQENWESNGEKKSRHSISLNVLRFISPGKNTDKKAEQIHGVPMGAMGIEGSISDGDIPF